MVELVLMQDEYVENLDRILSSEFDDLGKKFAGKKVGILFSGGVDSSLIAKFAEDAELNPTLYSFGTEKSKDRKFVIDFSKDMKIPLVFHEIQTEEIRKNISFIEKELAKIDIEPNPMEVALAVGVYLIGKRANADGVEVMLCGQGSDELFAGYKKYEELSEEDLKKKLRQDISSVMAKDIKRDAHMLLLSRIRLFAPYTNEEFVNYALDIPIEFKVKGEIKKLIIREVARKRGLPEYICERPKNAMQYSSGIQKVVSKIYKEIRLANG